MMTALKKELLRNYPQALKTADMVQHTPRFILA